MSWCAGWEEICQCDVPMREHTWYGLGGPARWFVRPRSHVELADILTRCKQHGIPWRILGQGANVLVPDGGFAGAVIHLGGPAFEEVRFDPPQVYAAAGADFPKLIVECIERGLGGFEALAGIPGTVGGLIRMNAGGRYGFVSEFVRTVRLIDPTGEFVTRRAEEIGFAYRHSNLVGYVVLAATFELKPGDPAELRRRYRKIFEEKAGSQPPVSGRTAGCVFKNPPGRAAGALIDQAGLKGTRRGAAEISTRHANFIIAHPGARAQDVLDLITLATERVRETFGVNLELEIEIW